MPRYNSQDNVAYFDHIQLIKDAAPSYTYDDEGNVISLSENPEQNVNAEYDKNDNLTSYTDVLGNKTILDYDNKNNLTITKSPKGVYGESFYNGVGNVTAQETRSAKSSEKAFLVIQTETDYTEAENGLKTNAYIKSTSDEHGNQTTYTYDWKTGKPKTVTNAKGTVTTYGYDSDYNRLIRVTADQSKVFYEYSGNQLNHIHFASTGGGVKENYYFDYDSFGNVEKTLVGTQVLSTNTYDTNNGALISTEYGTGDIIENKYDELGNLKKVIATPDGKSSKEKYTWAYNSAGVTTIHRDYENGRRYFYRYDSLGRLITQEIRSNEDENHNHIGSIGYEYDLRNNLTKLGIEIGNKAVPQQSYIYEKTNAEDSDKYAADNLITRYQLTSIRYIDYQYDSLNRLQNKKISTETPFLINYQYKSSKRNSGDVEKYKTTQLASEKLDDVTYSYTYDDVGNITAVKRKGADYRSYEYDALSQLTRENNKSGNKFTKVWNYNALGNIESVEIFDYTTTATSELGKFKTAINYVYGTDSDTGWKELLTSVEYKGRNSNGNAVITETKTIDYDEIGNPIKYLDYKMSWFGRQLEQITDDKGTTDTADDKTLSFTYGADGLRGTKTVTDASGTVTSEFVYANGQLAYEKRGDSELYFFYDGLGHLAAIRYYEDASEDTYTQCYVATNMAGDVLNLIDGDGNIIAKYAYDAWGNVISVKDGDSNDITDETNIALINPIRYRGYYLDRETGFYYLQSRYYDPAIGRFISADSEISGVGGEILGNNMFAYCLNNPVNMSDPTGHWPSWATVALGVAAAAVAVVATVATLGAAAPAAACTLAAVGMYYGASFAVATTVANVAVAATTVVASAYAADVAYSSVTGNSVLLDTVFRGNVAAYETGMFLTSFATASVFELAANSPGTCFIAGTLVSTLFGKTEIENIETGDKVWAENPETGQKELKTVVRTFENESSELVYVFVNGEEIITTPTHPFYVPEKGWTDAMELRAGDILVLRNGNYVIIEKVQHEILETPIKVYNFEVEDFHTYYVGSSSILVHNADCGPLKGNNATSAAKKLGYQKTNYRSHGQSVYYNAKDKTYITPDIDSHNGGVWKMAKSVEALGSKATRMGTYDENLVLIGE